MRTTLILKYIGMALLLESLFLLISTIVSAYNSFDGAFLPLLFSCLMTGVLGAFPSIFVRGGDRLSTREGYCIVVGSWLFCCLFGSFPYLLYDFSFSEAVFESVSGFTTTGASVIEDVEALPQGLLFWRMSTAWIGGIGIIAMFSLVVSSAGGKKRTLASAEVSDIALQYSGPRKHSFISTTVHTYVVLTAVSIVALRLGGMRWFDATTHAMSACSTCGFSTRNASIASFESPILEIMLIAIMLTSSIRFELLGSIFHKGGFSRLRRSEVTRVFLIMVLVGTAVLTVGLFADGTYGSFWVCLRKAAFQASSIFTTTGFATADTNVWPNACRSVIVAGSIVCGCSGSTSGGLKVDRLVAVIKSVRNRIDRIDAPNIVTSLKVESRSMDDEKLMSIFSFAFCYAAVICVGSVVYSLDGLDLASSWTAAVACVGNVGPGMGEVGSMANYGFMPLLSKWNSVLLMLLGRLEIFPLLTVLRIWKH